MEHVPLVLKRLEEEEKMLHHDTRQGVTVDTRCREVRHHRMWSNEVCFNGISTVCTSVSILDQFVDKAVILPTIILTKPHAHRNE